MKNRDSKLPKILVIVGPTASGKSDLAVLLAKELNGEVVSADSRQVYRGMDIGSGKITKTEMRNVPHYLLDVASPKRVFSVAQYKQQAEKAIKDILNRGKLPIICGGTGFYIQALVDGLILPEVKADQKLRKKLSQMSANELFLKLKKLDPKRAKNIDTKNSVRLMRAIEIATALGKVPPLRETKRYTPLFIGLNVPQETLHARISLRLTKRMRAGMVSEVKNLIVDGVSTKRMEALGLEYRFVSRFLNKEMSKTQMLHKLEAAIKQYAKRQYTWFRRDKRIQWIDYKDRTTALTLARDFLS